MVTVYVLCVDTHRMCVHSHTRDKDMLKQRRRCVHAAAYMRRNNALHIDGRVDLLV